MDPRVPSVRKVPAPRRTELKLPAPAGANAGAMDELLIVIVNYRTPRMTIECLESLEPEVKTVPGTRVIVVDNASGDDSGQQIAAAIDQRGWDAKAGKNGWARFEPLPKNGGFAYGNNRAIELSAPARSILLLNPDTLVRPGALRLMHAFLQEHADVGIVGSRLDDAAGQPQVSAFRFHSWLGEVERSAKIGPVTKLLGRWRVPIIPLPTRACRASWVAGACMMIRREVFEKIGGLDERFFMYYEEVDFCRRAAQAGWSCWYLPEARVAHLEGAASGIRTADARPKPRPRYWFDARKTYFVLNHGPLYATLADAAWLAGISLGRLRQVIQRRPATDPPRLVRDIARWSLPKVRCPCVFAVEAVPMKPSP